MIFITHDLNLARRICTKLAVMKDGKIVTNGGRVLGVKALGDDLVSARANAYKATEWINFENKYMRHDIGKALDDVDAN